MKHFGQKAHRLRKRAMRIGSVKIATLGGGRKPDGDH